MKLLFPIVLMALFMTSCQKDLELNSSEIASVQNAELTDAQKQLMDYIKEGKLVPNKRMIAARQANQDERTEVSSRSSFARENADYAFNRDAINRVINPNDYECGPTILDTYIPPLIANWTNQDFGLYNNFGDFAFIEADYYDNTGGEDYFGINGEYNNVSNRVFRDLKNFWNIPTDIIIGDAHGNIYNNIPMVVRIIKDFYSYNGGPVPDAIAQSTAQILKTVFGSSRFFNFNHPLLTFNAFAEPGYAPLGIVKKIVMGDGILKAYKDLGYDDVAYQAILAHEYGHHVQFARNVNFGNSPEGTRRTELMADAFSSYYMTHKRGLAMNWHRVQSFLEVFYSIGDCGFNSNGHHGTPNQRRKASQWGYNLANDAQKQGKILTSQEFIALFDAALPTLVAPDAN